MKNEVASRTIEQDFSLVFYIFYVGSGHTHTADLYFEFETGKDEEPSNG